MESTSNSHIFILLLVIFLFGIFIGSHYNGRLRGDPTKEFYDKINRRNQNLPPGVYVYRL